MPLWTQKAENISGEGETKTACSDSAGLIELGGEEGFHPNGVPEGIIGCLELVGVPQRTQQAWRMGGRREADLYGSGFSTLM